MLIAKTCINELALKVIQKWFLFPVGYKLAYCKTTPIDMMNYVYNKAEWPIPGTPL